MDFLPIHLNVRGMSCLVIGAGPVAAGKATVLLQAGATVRVVAPEVSRGIDELHANQRIGLERRRFADSDLDGVDLIIAATADPTLNHSIVARAQSRRILANAVTDAEAGQFIMPAIVDRSPVVISVSTGGASPAVARHIRARLETMIPRSFGRLARLAGEFRDVVKGAIARPSERRAFWDHVLEGPIAELVHVGQEREAADAIHAALGDSNSAPTRGEVYLVGAGPGDPELLSIRAMRLIQQADVVVYDRLVSPEVLDLVRRDAERIYAGKRRSVHTMNQPDINQLLVDLASGGKRVLRLKGGDPFIFGRGGEEIATLAAASIPFQVVPGITAASGCAAYAGIPLTHRDYAHACIFVTGHLRDGTLDLEWSALAGPRQTVVFYMGLVSLPIICEQLIAHGLPPDTACAVIQQGTTNAQEVFAATLQTMPRRGEAAKPPAIFIVGNVVRLRETLNWFAPGDLLNADLDGSFSETSHRERAT
ncbi:MAG: siroheme synthase CysG [Pseudomonadota bacterium]